MKLLSFDPGIERIGYAVFTDEELSCAGLIQTEKSKNTAQRLLCIFREIEAILQKTAVDVVAMEQLFFFSNKKTVISVAQAQGIIMLCAARNNLPVIFLTPLQIKHAVTGDGHADKKQVQKMLRLILGQKYNLTQDDIADAVACGLAFCYVNKHVLIQKK